MSNKDYIVNKIYTDKQGGYIDTECKPVTHLITNCIICGNEVVISVWENTPKVCEGCKNAVRFAKAMCGGNND